MVITVIVNVLLVGFLLTEFISRKKGESSSLVTGEADKGSTNLVGVSFGLAILLLLAVSIFHFGFFSIQWIGYLGLAVMAVGLSLRFWSMSILGKFYTRTLKTMEDHKIVRTGPYKVIRHPGYLSSILIWTGTGLAIQNWIMASFCFVIFVLTYSYRIVAEEKMLVSQFGKEYEDYQKNSWRLFPLLF